MMYQHRPHRGERSRHELAEIKPGEVDRMVPCFQRIEVQHVADHPREAERALVDGAGEIPEFSR
jgi:hypothetical protein